jgi:hypothetical protein
MPATTPDPVPVTPAHPPIPATPVPATPLRGIGRIMNQYWRFNRTEALTALQNQSITSTTTNLPYLFPKPALEETIAVYNQTT